MINSVWNLCRACPSNTEDKYREYHRNGGWQHGGAPYTPVDVVRRQPDLTCQADTPAAGAAGALEPALPRKKKYPDSAYRCDQVLRNLKYPGCSGTDLANSAAAADARARSEERSLNKLSAGQRSRSADPSLGRRRPQEETEEDDVTAHVIPEPLPMDEDGTLMTQSYPPPSSTQQLNECGGVPAAGAGSGPGKTEYRSQFAWPPASAVLMASETRKSLSMGTIAHPGQHQGSRQTETCGMDGIGHGRTDDEDTPKSNHKNKVTEYKAKFRPFSSYLYVDGNWRKSPKATNTATNAASGESDDDSHAWYAEVVERLKKADEYKSRSHGSPGGVTGGGNKPLSNQERRAELWNQVRERSNLVALTLATSTSRPTTVREDKTPERPGIGPAKPHRTSTAPAVHKKDGTRPVSADRKKSPVSEASKAKTPVESRPTPPASRHPPPRTSRHEEKATGTAQQRVSSAGPSSTSSKGSATPTPVVRPRSRPPAPSATDQSAAATNGPEDGKIWLKPASAPPPVAAEPPKDKKEEKKERPCSFPEQVNGTEAILNGGQDYPSPSPLPEPHVGPVPLTTVRSPEEVTGVKSPDPETWTVPLETNRGLEWMDGHTPGQYHEMNRVKSPPLSGPHKHVVCTQPTNEESTQPPTTLPAETVQSKITAEDSTGVPAKVENMVSSADVLDRARSRLDQFWSKSK